MRSLPVRWVLPALLVVLCLTGCRPMTAGTGALVHCSVTLDRPSPDNRENPRTIVAGTRFWCEDPGAGRLSLTLHLQRQNSKGTWVDDSVRSFTMSGSQTVRLPDQRYQTRTLSMRCASGVFRTTVVGHASGTHTFAADYDLVGPSTTNPCDERLPF
jgi:hypothetical protein